MQRKLLNLLMFWTVLALGGADSVVRAAEPGRITGPIAKVNGVPISAETFYGERDKITARGAEIPTDRLARIEENILKRLIEDELIDQAVKAARIVVPAQDVAAGLADYKARFQSEEQFENYLKHGRFTIASIEERIRQRRALELLLHKRGAMHVSDAEARDFYEQNIRFYTEKAGIRASHILIKVTEDAPAADVDAAMVRVRAAQLAISNGTPFDEVARTMSEGPAASDGGDLGFFSEGRMVKEFEDVAFKLAVGVVSGPVRTRFGFHIIKVTEKRVDREKPFSEVKEQIVASLQNKKFFIARRHLVDELTRAATIWSALPPAPADDGDTETETEPAVPGRKMILPPTAPSEDERSVDD